MKERVVGSRTVFAGRLLRVDVLDVEMADGRRAVREVIRHPGAAVVLAETPEGKFLLVRQHRAAAAEVLTEVVAGTLDPGEDPEACARRELAEETGREALALTRLGVFLPVPGYSEERLHIYHARLSARRVASDPDDDERIETVEMTAGEVVEAILDGRIKDAKTVVAWWLYERMAPRIAAGC
jgi:ADP-ribose pyrophosphatase